MYFTHTHARTHTRTHKNTDNYFRWHNIDEYWRKHTNRRIFLWNKSSN